MIKRLFIILALCSFPLQVWGYAELETERGYLDARGALDIGTTFWKNDGPESLYPESAGGSGHLTLRLIFDALAGGNVRFKINGFQTLQYLSETGLVAPTLESYRTRWLTYDWGDGGKLRAPLVLDEFTMKVYIGPVDLSIGRQPIGLGNNFIFTPNDFFHPFAPGAVDTAFRPGVDSLRIDARVGELSQISVIAAMGYGEDDQPSWRRSAILLRGSTNAGGFDFSLMGGKAEGRYLAAAAFSGEAWVLGLRGEGNLSFPIDDPRHPFGQLALGLDHRWENSLHLMFEYYYHGNGTTDSGQYLDQLAVMDFGADLFLGEHYAALVLSGQPMPLLTLQGMLMANLTDPSILINPSIVYNAADEVEVIAAATIPIGLRPQEDGPVFLAGEGPFNQPRLRSEYGMYPYSVKLLARFYF